MKSTRETFMMQRTPLFSNKGILVDVGVHSVVYMWLIHTPACFAMLCCSVQADGLSYVPFELLLLLTF